MVRLLHRRKETLEGGVTFLLSFILVLEDTMETETLSPSLLFSADRFLSSLEVTHLVFICVCWGNHPLTTSCCIHLN